HLDERVVAALTHLGARLVVVVPITQLDTESSGVAPGHPLADLIVVGDHTDAVKSWFDDKAGSAAFVRPDRFVAAFDSPLGIGARIEEVVARIGIPPSHHATRPDITPVQE